MTPASRALNAVQALQHVQTDDEFVHKIKRFDHELRRRKKWFLTQGDDISNESWQAFLNGYTHLQRRKMVFERCRDFPALHQASANGDREQVRALIQTAGVCVLERDACGRIALHHAVINEHSKIIKKFLRRQDAKLQVLVQDNSNRSPLHYALEKMEVLAIHRRQKVKIPALMTIEMKIESKRYRRLWKLADRMLSMVNRSVLNGDCDLETGGENLKTVDLRCRGDVWDVCRSGDLKRLETIVEIYGCAKDDWELSELKRTLLHEACENQQLSIVYFLISTVGLPVQLQDVAGCTALHCAARRGFVDGCQLLLGQPPFETGDRMSRYTESAEELVLVQDIRGRTALHWCLLSSNDPLTRLEIATLLSQSCTSALHICDQDGVYPLHLAIWRGELELVQTFIGLGANVGVSSIVLLPKPHKNVEKATWAPCGIVFQRLRLKNAQKVTTPSDNIEEANLGGTNSPRRSRVSVLDWENVRHPVETLWYWQASCRNLEPSEKINSSEKHLLTDSKIVSGDELGCWKYGGICDRCRHITEYNRALSSTTTSCTVQVLPPLVLALRMCRLKTGDRLLEHQVAVIDLLLTNGANPDGISDTIMEEIEEMNVHVPPSLVEGLRASFRYPQILTKLLLHGATRISIHEIIHWCSASSNYSDKVEPLLNQLLELENVVNNLDFMTKMFSVKYFHTLQECLKQWLLQLQKCTNTNDKVQCELYRNSLWKGIYEKLLVWSKVRRKLGRIEPIEIDHLKFIYDLSYKTIGDDVNLQENSLWELFEYCMNAFLQNQSNGCHQQEQMGPKTEKWEKVVLICLLAVFKYWKKMEFDDQQTLSKLISWFQSTVSIGYFDCALVILEKLHHLGQSRFLLDTVFEFHASAIDSRRYVKDDRFLYHREFLIVCTENLMKNTSSSVDENHQLSSSIASVKSIVHMCANNFQLSFIKSCTNIVFPDGLVNLSTNELNSTRVRGKTMVQWIVTHLRVDIMEWLLLSVPVGSERGFYWSKFVASPSVLVSTESSTLSSFMEQIFLFYRENIQQYHTVNERDKMFLDLVINCAIPKDSVTLARQLIDCWVSTNSGNDGIENIRVALKEARVLHFIVRWNAVEITEMCLSGQLWSEINWPNFFIEQNQERHEVDNCNPLKLCQLLGHNQLYKVLSSALLQESFKPDEKLDEEEIGEHDTEEERTTATHFGLLRSILTINEGLRTVETFKGYRRRVNVQCEWISAVSLDQVSHLQAMALTRDPNTSIYDLILTAIKSGSLNALKWIVDTFTPLNKYLSQAEGSECIYNSAKHSSDLYAEMTLLLLEKNFHPGRLSGDGMGIPLLHRSACFTNSSLACRIMTKLLKRADCDVNVLDAFGNPPVCYALASGCLNNACFLINQLNCRLEGEYEGQSSFYYVLHMAPSFSWRIILRELLLTKRDRAFLHCDAESKTCGCKGYERPQQDQRMTSQLCGFCGHKFISHRNVPLPSWFRDQYDTYINIRKSVKSLSKDEDITEIFQQYPADNGYDTVNDEDEEIILENSRGRLNVNLLQRITTLRFNDILHTNGLSLAVVCEEEEITMVSEDEINEEIVNNCSLTVQTSTENTLVSDKEGESLEMLRIVPGNTNICIGTTILSSCTAKNVQKFVNYPIWLQPEFAMVHSPNCLCQTSVFVVNRRQLAHTAVCRWLRHTAIIHTQHQHTGDLSLSWSSGVTENTILAIAAVQSAFEHWRGISQLTEHLPARAVPRSGTPLPRLVTSVLFHWKHSKEFVAFQRWKMHQTSAEVTHHRLVTRLENVTAEMRSNRFLTLQLRQQQLQDSTRDLNVRQ